MNNHLYRKTVLLFCLCVLILSCKGGEIDDPIIPPTPKPSSLELTNLSATVTPTSNDPKDPDRRITLSYTYDYFYDYDQSSQGQIWVDWDFMNLGLCYSNFFGFSNTNDKIVTETKNDQNAGGNMLLGKTLNIRLQLRGLFPDQTIISEKTIAVTIE